MDGSKSGSARSLGNKNRPVKKPETYLNYLLHRFKGKVSKGLSNSSVVLIQINVTKDLH